MIPFKLKVNNTRYIEWLRNLGIERRKYSGKYSEFYTCAENATLLALKYYHDDDD